ncbi:MAG TPA: Yip1 family protein [Candidatus Binataceae bacterium]|jgi:hypothetical protein|nr:Yip1 family protein [Candidatus Binataceae bacterium]
MADEGVEHAAGDVWVDSWLSIWYRPRSTIRRIVDTDARKFVLVIAWLAGAMAAINSQIATTSVELPATVPHFPRLGPIGITIAAIISGLFGIIGIYGLAPLYRWSGQMLGGTATTVEVRAALAWSQVPGIYFGIVTLLATVLGVYTPPLAHTTSPFNVVESLVGIWIFVVSLKCLGEVHRFSAWRALGAILLGSLAIIAVVVGVVITIWLAVWVGRSIL